jgi:HEAT repeat protein
MLEAGRLKEMGPLLRSEDGFAAMGAVMRDGSMQQKMGVMLAVEQLLEGQPHSLDGALPHLLPLLESDVVPQRGDVADLLGKIGAPGAREGLTRLLSDENPDVREVAEDALEMLRAPS